MKINSIKNYLILKFNNTIINVLFLVCITSPFISFEQTLIHTQEFAGTTPSGWTTIDNGGASSWNITSTSSPCSGSYTGRLAAAANDDYIISEGYTLTAGNSYSITLSHLRTATFNVYAGTAQTSAAMLAGTNMLSSTANPSSCTDISTSNSFVPSSTGTYYFGFRVEGNSSYIARIDNIRIYETAPVTITWDGSSSTAWSTAANWDLNRVPSGSDIIVIPSGLTNYPATVPAGSYNSLSMDRGTAGTTSIGASTFSGNLSLTSSSAGNTFSIDGNLSIGGNFNAGVSGDDFNLDVNGDITIAGSFNLGSWAATITSTISNPITSSGAFTMGFNANHSTTIDYTSPTIDAITASNTGSFIFYGTVNYNANSGVQRVMKPTYEGAVVASNGGNRFMNGDLDINNSLTISGGKWYSGNSIEQSPSGALGGDLNVRASNSPYKGSGKSGRWQGIFLATDLGSVGANDLITSLSFYITSKYSDRAFNNFTIKAALVSYSGFTQSGLDWPFKNETFTTVFDAKDVTTTDNSWNTHIFDTPIKWDGVSNVLIEITFNNLAAAGGSDLAPDGTADDQIQYYAGAWADDIIIWKTAASSDVTSDVNGNNSNYKNNSIFNIADGPYDINITNDWLNSGGEFYHLYNTVIFDGSTNQNVTTNGDYFYNFTVDNTNTTEALTLSDNCNIEGTGTLTDGVIITGSNKLISLSTAAADLTGYSDTSYVYGNLRRYIATNTSTYGLPLGNGTGTTNYFLADIINASLTGTAYLDTKFVTATAADYNQTGFEALSKEMSGSGVTTKAMKDLDAKGYFQIDPDLQPSGGTYSMKMYNTNYTLANWVDNDQCIFKRPSGSSDMSDFNMAGTISEDNGSGRLVADGFLLSTGISSFSELIPALATASPLPVELINYNVEHYKKTKVLVSWNTLSEKNCDYYTVERTIDGENFEVLSNSNCQQYNYSLTNYKTIDEQPYRGTSYYRLSQVDLDGKRTYYPLKSITFNDEEILIFPNPTNNSSFTIEYKALTDDVLNVVIYNTLGEMIYKVKMEQKKGSFSEQVKTSLLSKGIYYVELSNNQFGVIVEKVVVN